MTRLWTATTTTGRSSAAPSRAFGTASRPFGTSSRLFGPVAAYPQLSPPAPGIIQGIFKDAPERVRRVREYVRAHHFERLAEFDRVAADRGSTTDLATWLGGLGVSLEDVERSLPRPPSPIRGRPLVLGGEHVRGSLDLPEGSDEEMEDFQTGLSEGAYNRDEMEGLDSMLRKRQAPHDEERRRLLAEHASDRAFEDEEMGRDEFDEPYLADSEEESSGTETEGSDSDDERRFQRDETLRQRAKKRLARATKLLNTGLHSKRLRKLASEEDSGERSKLLFKKGKRPRKERLFRKEAKFSLPALKVGERAKLPTVPSQQQVADLERLNQLLELGLPIQAAEKLVGSKFSVAQYRGLFYSRRGFDKRSRKQHRGLDERDRPTFSSSALAEGPFGARGYYYLYNDPSRREDLEKYQKKLEVEASQISRTLHARRREPPTEEVRRKVPRVTDRLKPRSMGDLFTHFYSEAYDDFFEASKESLSRPRGATPGKLDPLFRGLPNPLNPKVSTGDVPTHAARYAYGLKPYQGHEEEVLEPSYGESGKPRHPYSGKMYVSLHPLSDYEGETEPSQLVPLQHQGRINIGQVILPERESQFEGMLPGGRVKATLKAKFPDFSKPYKKVYAEKYGLSEELFADFAKAFAAASGEDERTFVEAMLSTYLATHSELRAIEAATQAAAREGRTLVYRTGPRSFGWEPPELRGPSEPSKSSKPKPLDLKALLAALAKSQASLEPSSGQRSGAPSLFRAPLDLDHRVTVAYGAIIRITGDEIACYIRSLVTAAARVHGLISGDEIENIVGAVQDHLAAVRLRTRGEMIDAGGLVAAEVRRVLHELTGRAFDPEVHVVMWDGSVGHITDFAVNTGTQAVWLYYTPGHFDLIDKTA